MKVRVRVEWLGSVNERAHAMKNSSYNLDPPSRPACRTTGMYISYRVMIRAEEAWGGEGQGHRG